MKVAQGRKSLGVVMRARGGIGIRARLRTVSERVWVRVPPCPPTYAEFTYIKRLIKLNR